MVPTIFFRVLFVFVILSHDRRKIAERSHARRSCRQGTEYAETNPTMGVSTSNARTVQPDYQIPW